MAEVLINGVAVWMSDHWPAHPTREQVLAGEAYLEGLTHRVRYFGVGHSDGSFSIPLTEEIARKVAAGYNQRWGPKWRAEVVAVSEGENYEDCWYTPWGGGVSCIPPGKRSAREV